MERSAWGLNPRKKSTHSHKHTHIPPALPPQFILKKERNNKTCIPSAIFRPPTIGQCRQLEKGPGKAAHGRNLQKKRREGRVLALGRVKKMCIRFDREFEAFGAVLSPTRLALVPGGYEESRGTPRALIWYPDHRNPSADDPSHAPVSKAVFGGFGLFHAVFCGNFRQELGLPFVGFRHFRADLSASFPSVGRSARSVEGRENGARLKMRGRSFCFENLLRGLLLLLFCGPFSMNCELFWVGRVALGPYADSTAKSLGSFVLISIEGSRVASRVAVPIPTSLNLKETRPSLQ